MLFNKWFQSNQLVLQQKQKTKTQALAKGEEERERGSEKDVWCIQKRADINNSMGS